jgi:hypothetical protein
MEQKRKLTSKKQKNSEEKSLVGSTPEQNPGWL